MIGIRRLCLAVLVSLSVVTTGAGQAPTAPAAQSEAEVWPDAETMAERRRAAERRPLFAQAEPLAFTLIADFRAVQRDRNPESTRTYPATLIVKRPDGSDASIAMRIRTRGHSRRRPTTCSFAPLRLEFEGDTAGTPFEGQRNLKLGTHCRDVKEYDEYILREYGVYRMFNLLTPNSFRARLSKVSYVQSTDDKPVISRLGLFLEDDDDVARRMEGRIMDVPRALFKDVDQDLLTLAMTFEYMIGNTDYSIFALHNFRLIRTPDRKTYAVPYDFDMSGLVNASYAIPDRAFGLKSVRDRLYRGPCRPLNEVEPILAKFRTEKANILALFESLPDLSREQRKEAKEYLDEFYRDLDRPNEVKSIFVSGRCSTKSTM